MSTYTFVEKHHKNVLRIFSKGWVPFVVSGMLLGTTVSFASSPKRMQTIDQQHHRGLQKIEVPTCKKISYKDEFKHHRGVQTILLCMRTAEYIKIRNTNTQRRRGLQIV